jgi:metal-responsive CopG/Arc/MetJ family transcriptional regulator
MGKAKIAVTIDSSLLESVDRYVKQQKASSRSSFFEDAVAERVERYEKSRLARELEKIEPAGEREFAEEGFSAENEQWPEY